MKIPTLEMQIKARAVAPFNQKALRLCVGLPGYQGIFKTFAMQKCQLLAFNCSGFSPKQALQAACRVRMPQVLIFL